MKKKLFSIMLMLASSLSSVQAVDSGDDFLNEIVSDFMECPEATELLFDRVPGEYTTFQQQEGLPDGYLSSMDPPLLLMSSDCENKPAKMLAHLVRLAYRDEWLALEDARCNMDVEEYIAKLCAIFSNQLRLTHQIAKTCVDEGVWPPEWDALATVFEPVYLEGVCLEPQWNNQDDFFEFVADALREGFPRELDRETLVPEFSRRLLLAFSEDLEPGSLLRPWDEVAERFGPVCFEGICLDPACTSDGDCPEYFEQSDVVSAARQSWHSECDVSDLDVSHTTIRFLNGTAVKSVR